jgi:Ca2+-binding EF-hand superfamily protein
MLNLIQENEIKDAFDFYDTEKKGLIARNNLRSILGNFAFSKMNGKEIEEEINKNPSNQSK